MSTIVHEFMIADTPEGVATRAVVSSLNQFYEVLYSGDMFLTDTELQRLRQACNTFGAEYLKLRSMACDQGRLWWQVRPNHHKMQHFFVLTEVLNPRCVQCYGEESLIGTTTKIWKRSVSGRYQDHVQTSVLLKKLCGLKLRLEG